MTGLAVESPAGSRAAATTPAVPDSGTGGFAVRLDNFEGPFDLLLSLISKHKMDVTEVALSKVTDEFIAHIKAAGEVWDLDQTTSFLLVASTLLDLKAARLLPQGDVEDEEDLALLEARDLLFARLLQYRAFKLVADVLDERMTREALRHARSVGLEERFATLLPEVLIGLGLQELAGLAARALAPKPAPEMIGLGHIHAPAVSVREQATVVVGRLRGSGTMSFRALSADAPDVMTRVARFLALLELFREGVVAFDQMTPLGELSIRWTGTDDVEIEIEDEFEDEFDGAPPEEDMTTETLEVPLAELRPALEAVLMVADEPLDVATLASAVGYPVAQVADALGALVAEYDEARRGFELRNVAGGWRYYTREEFAPVVERFVLEGQQARLTQAALETLAVVAYKQPVSRSRVSAIRGVNVDGVMRTLLNRGLVEEAGTDEETGAHLYRTSSYFLERIGVNSIEELPELAPFLPGVDDFDDDAEVAQVVAADSGELDRMREIETDDEGLVRLQKLLAQSGVASRRKCEELMLAGEVEVDDQVVTRLGTKVDPGKAKVRVRGRRLPPITDHVYLVLNKPRGVVSTMSDPEGRPTLSDFVEDRPERLFHVGRLDTDTEGLILLTNHGDFAHRMAHPSYEVDKTYVAEVDGVIRRETLQRLLAGVTLDDGPVQVSAAKVRSTHGERSLVELVIHEGRNRIVRRLLDHVGHPVRRLTRTQIGPVRLAGINQGSLRELDEGEIGTLLDAAGL